MSLDPHTIYTDHNGVPFERPERPAWLDDPSTPKPITDGQAEEYWAYQRAFQTYERVVEDYRGRRFAKHLRRALQTQTQN